MPRSIRFARHRARCVNISETHFANFRERILEPQLYPLALEETEPRGVALAFVCGRPKTRAACIDLGHRRLLQALDADHARAQIECALLLSRCIEDSKVVAAHLVEHQYVVEARSMAIEQALEQVDRILAGIQHM